MLIFTYGSFDLLHRGHCSLLGYCRGLAGKGRVTVGLDSDACVRRRRGEGHPIVPVRGRQASIDMLRLVDEVVVFDDDSAPAEWLRRWRPDVLVRGAEHERSWLPGQEYAGRLEFAPMVPQLSAARVLECARKLAESGKPGDELADDDRPLLLSVDEIAKLLDDECTGNASHPID